MKLVSWSVGLMIPVLISGCVGGPHARSGGLAGAMAGGAIGAMAGAEDDKSLEGAAIGALAGSAVGGALGDQVDRDIQRNEANRQISLQQAQGNAVTIEQVIQLSNSGLDEQLIVNQIQNNGVLATLSTQDLLTLKQNGVSDSVISAWQQTPPIGTPASSTSRSTIRPVIVHERWLDPACRDRYWGYGPAYGPRHAPRYGRRGGFHVQF